MFPFGVVMLELKLELLLLGQEAQVRLDQIFWMKLEEIRKVVADQVDGVVREVLVLDRLQCSLFRDIRILEIRDGRWSGRRWYQIAVHGGVRDYGLANND